MHEKQPALASLTASALVICWPLSPQSDTCKKHLLIRMGHLERFLHYSSMALLLGMPGPLAVLSV